MITPLNGPDVLYKSVGYKNYMNGWEIFILETISLQYNSSHYTHIMSKTFRCFNIFSLTHRWRLWHIYQPKY